jgi:hypothetical protein
MWKFIIENPTTIIGWVVVLLRGALAAPDVAHWPRRREERRREHLAEIESNVLQPMLVFLDGHVLPILRQEAGNVDIYVKQTTDPTELVGSFFEQFICISQVTDPLQVYILGSEALPEMPLPPSGPLVEDARRYHFRDLFRRWDRVMVHFLEYNAGCRRYVETLRAKIVEETGLLPEFTLRAYALGPEWVNASALAVVVFLKQIDLPLREFTFRPRSDPREWCYNTLTVAKGTVAEVVALEEQVKKLLRQRDQVLRLMEAAKST